MRGSPEGMWRAGGSKASGRGGFGQGVGPPAFPWKRRGVSAEELRLPATTRTDTLPTSPGPNDTRPQ